MIRLRSAAPLVVWLASTTASAVGEEACQRLVLVDATEELGVSFVHDRGANGLKHLPETMGAGLAWLDFDGDGWLDLYLVQSGPFPPPDATGTAAGARRGLLLRNLAGRRFEAVTWRAAAGHSGYGQGVLAADLDGNGATDLVVTTFGGDQLLLNTGRGVFEAQPLEGLQDGSSWSSSAAAADADSDGDLDLYVSRYVDYDPAAPIFCGDPETGERRYCDPSIFAGASDVYLENLGGGRFVEATARAGLGGADGRGLGVLFADLDDDLRPDIYVANDLTPNTLFGNRGDGTFENASLLSGAAVNRDGKPEAGMGVALGDYNGDLLPDLVVTNFDVETNTYYQAAGALSFVDLSAASGFGTPSFNFLAFGVVATDLDGDADLDVYIANGHIFERPRRDNTAYRQRDQILLGDGHGYFEELRCDWLEKRRDVARGLAAADLDNDGDADLAMQENGGPATVLRNERAPSAWLGVALRGTRSGTEAVGARAILTHGEHRQVRWVLAGDSYQSSSDRRPLFALPATVADSELELRWPTGHRLRMHQPPTGSFLVFAER